VTNPNSLAFAAAKATAMETPRSAVRRRCRDVHSLEADDPERRMRGAFCDTAPLRTSWPLLPSGVKEVPRGRWRFSGATRSGVRSPWRTPCIRSPRRGASEWVPGVYPGCCHLSFFLSSPAMPRQKPLSTRPRWSPRPYRAAPRSPRSRPDLRPQRRRVL